MQDLKKLQTFNQNSVLLIVNTVDCEIQISKLQNGKAENLSNFYLKIGKRTDAERKLLEK